MNRSGFITSWHLAIFSAPYTFWTLPFGLGSIAHSCVQLRWVNSCLTSLNFRSIYIYILALYLVVFGSTLCLPICICICIYIHIATLGELNCQGLKQIHVLWISCFKYKHKWQNYSCIRLISRCRRDKYKRSKNVFNLRLKWKYKNRFNNKTVLK